MGCPHPERGVPGAARAARGATNFAQVLLASVGEHVGLERHAATTGHQHVHQRGPTELT